jgi:hypothetical protein
MERGWEVTRGLRGDCDGNATDGTGSIGGERGEVVVSDAVRSLGKVTRNVVPSPTFD